VREEEGYCGEVYWPTEEEEEKLAARKLVDAVGKELRCSSLKCKLHDLITMSDNIL
jgi:hypothetical protein